MRVARLIARLPPARGGKEIHGAELSRALVRLGVRQTVFVRVGDPIDPRVELVRMPSGFGADSRRNLVAYSLWAAAALVRTHRRAPFELIHVHGDFVEASAAAAAAAVCRVPVQLTLHSDLAPIRWHDALRRRAFGRMQTIWTVSQDGADAARHITAAADVRVRPSGVRDAFFSTPAAGPRRGVLFVGRLSPVKGLEHLIAAHDLLRGELDDPWTVVAEGSGPYADRIRAELARRGIAQVEEPDAGRLAARLAGAAVFVLPSVDSGIFREGTPTALLEAIATRTPVVASSVGGTAAALGGDGGVLVAPGDAPSLARAIAGVLADPKNAAMRAERAYEAGAALPWAAVAAEVAARYRAAAGPAA